MVNINNVTVLSLDYIRDRAPAVFASAPASHVSKEYKFVNTASVLDTLINSGWEPIQANQQKVRVASRSEGTKHQILLRHSSSQTEGLEIGGLIPTLRIINSHDWSSRFSMFFGMLRLVCSNGLTVSGAQFAGFDVRHDAVQEDVQTVLGRFNSYSNMMLDTAQRWSKIELDRSRAETFFMDAARIRFGPDANSDHADTLKMVRRQEDITPTLWNAYNVAQENSMKGGGKRGQMKRLSRPLTNIATAHAVNTGLFELAASYA